MSASANTSVSRRVALASLLLSAISVASVNAAKEEYKPKFTWWAILIMMIGIVVVITVALVIYFCVFRKEDDAEEKEKAVEDSVDGQSQHGDAAVPPARDSEDHEPTQRQKDYPVE